MNRREFALSIFGLTGINVAKDVKESKKGFIVYYVNVGYIPFAKVESFVERVKDHWTKTDIRKALDDWELMIIPVRPPQETKIEIFSVVGESETVDYLNVKKLMKYEDGEPFVAPNKKLVEDYILIMLGGPVVKVELNQQQLDFAYDITLIIFENIAKVKGLIALNMNGTAHEIFQKMALARAKIILGNIRRESQNVEDLIEEGESELEYCMDLLKSN